MLQFKISNIPKEYLKGLARACILAPLQISVLASAPSSTSHITSNIDHILEERWALAQIKPSHIVDELEFLKRAHLVLIGRRPSLNEIKAFEKNSSPQKKEELVDSLLASEGYVSHHYNQWADLLRVKFRLPGFRNQKPGESYSAYLKEIIRNNKPYDKIVHELISAEGPAFQKGNGATGFYIRDRGMPLDHMSNTIRAFTGTRLECAQCHNDPFQKFTQKDFYSMAAFTSGDFRFRKKISDDKKLLKKIYTSYRNNREDAPREFDAMQFVNQILESQVHDTGRGAILLPWDYKEDHGKPFEVVPARSIMGEEVHLNLDPEKNYIKTLARFINKNDKNARAPYKMNHSRKALAEWLTSPSHPQFTRIYVNRIWENIMGGALTAHYDSLKDGQVSEHVELENYLIQSAKDLAYNTKNLQKAIVLSRAFQRKAFNPEAQSTEGYFNGPHLRRLNAEQIWDSICLLYNGDQLDEPSTSSDSNALIYQYFSNAIEKLGIEEGIHVLVKELCQYKTGMSIQVIITKSKIIHSNLTSSQKKTLLQDLDKLNAQPKKIKKNLGILKRKLASILSVTQPRIEQSGDVMASEMSSMQSMTGTMITGARSRKKDSSNQHFRRASELDGSVYGNHFLRRFGSSDRVVMDGAHREPSITQSLWLFNHGSSNHIYNKKTHIFNSLHPITEPKEKIDNLYLTILSRYPTAAEIEHGRQLLSQNPYEGTKDLIWILMNSHEYKFFF